MSVTEKSKFMEAVTTFERMVFAYDSFNRCHHHGKGFEIFHSELKMLAAQADTFSLDLATTARQVALRRIHSRRRTVN